MRCFIAINLPESIQSRIFHASEILKSKNLFEGKFVKKGDLHLTLKFLGTMTHEEIEEVSKKLKELKISKFNCQVGELGVFDENHIKVIWASLISDKFDEIHNKIHEQTAQRKLDYKKFNPHVTIARVNHVEDQEKLLEELNGIKLKKDEFEVKNFYLMKSELSREGPEYKIIEEFNLID